MMMMGWPHQNILLQLLLRLSATQTTTTTTTQRRLVDQILAQTITTGFLLLQATTTTLIAWNCVIRAYAKSPTPIRAILVYNHFVRASPPPPLRPDSYTYPALLTACGRLPSLPKGGEIHGRITKLGLINDVFVQNSLIHFYGVVRQIADARRLFDDMAERDLVTWNSILMAYVSTPALWGEAIVLFREMVISGGIGADEITLVILLSECNAKRLDCGRMLHAYGLKKGFGFGLNLGNALLGMYAKVSDADTTSRLFAEMSSKDRASYTILMNCYAELGSLDIARSIFDVMPSRDLISWNSMINGYVKAERASEALELFRQMVTETVNPDEFTIVGVISACASLSDLEFGRSIHRLIRQLNVKEDVFVGTALVDMYAKCGSLKEAVLAFDNMKHKDVHAWTVLISALANYGHGKEASSAFAQMERHGLVPNEATFVAILSACSHSGLVDEGCIWFDRMVEVYKIRPKIEHFGCVIDLLGRAGLLHKAEGLIGTLLHQDRIIAYKTLLSACINYSDVVLGEKVAKELIKLDPRSHGVFVLLSNFYASDNRWDDVEEMRRIARELDLKKEVGISLLK